MFASFIMNHKNHIFIYVWLSRAKSDNFYFNTLINIKVGFQTAVYPFIALHSAHNIYHVKMTCALDFDYLLEHHQEFSYTSKDYDDRLYNMLIILPQRTITIL